MARAVVSIDSDTTEDPVAVNNRRRGSGIQPTVALMPGVSSSTSSNASSNRRIVALA